MDEELKQPCEKCDEYLAGWKRAQADYANLKKETEREKSEFTKYGNEKMLQSIFPAVDLLEIAMKSTPVFTSISEEDRIKFAGWMTGLKAVQEQWESLCKSVGLERVPTDGTMFDPQLHEVLMEARAETMPNAEPGTITTTINNGWKLNGKLIRPARVIVQPQE